MDTEFALIGKVIEKQEKFIKIIWVLLQRG
jgi:hypothetical protein